MNQDDNDAALAHQQELEQQQWIIQKEYLLEQSNQDLNLIKKESNHD